MPSVVQPNEETPFGLPSDDEVGDNNVDAPRPMADQFLESDSEQQGDGLETRRRDCCTKTAVATLLVAFILFVILDSTIGEGWVGDTVGSFLQWIEENPVPGIFVFILVYFVASIFFIPGSILTLGAGFVFANAFGLGPGIILGTLAVFFGASAGATASFLLGRFLLRDWVSGWTPKYTIFEALDKALAEKGFRIMALLRLSPIIPFNALNYIAGVTAIGFWPYVLALLAMLPGTMLYVFLGASAGSLADSANSGDSMTVTIIVVVVGIVFGVMAVALTSYYARIELKKVTQQQGEETYDAPREENDEELGPGSSSSAST